MHEISTEHEPTVKLKMFSDIELEKAPEDSSIMYYELGALDSSCSQLRIESLQNSQRNLDDSAPPSRKAAAPVLQGTTHLKHLCPKGSNSALQAYFRRKRATEIIVSENIISK